MQAAKPEERASELQQPQEVRAPLVVADEQGAALREPRQRPLHHPPAGRKPLLAGGWIEPGSRVSSPLRRMWETSPWAATASSPVGLS